MKFCFVGLGNPGKEYERTRHNVGFLAVDRISKHLAITKFNYFDDKNLLWANTDFEGKSIYLVKPYSYMNNSGIPLSVFCKYKNIGADRLIVVYDDVDTELGRVRIRKCGSSGGHKGMESIISNFQTSNIKRIRIGIGPKPDNKDLKDYVLSAFTVSEFAVLNSVMDKMPWIFEDIIRHGIDYAMSKYNSTS